MREIDLQNRAGFGADRLQHGNGFQFLFQERADAAGHADPADHQGDEPDQPEIHRELAEEPPEHRLGLLIRAHPHRLVRKGGRQLALNGPRAQRLGQFEEMPVRHPAARLDELGRVKALAGHQHAGAEAERAGRPVRLLLQDAGDPEISLADLQHAADLQAETDQQGLLGQHLAAAEQRRRRVLRIGPQCPIERIAGLDRFEFDQLRAGRRRGHRHQFAHVHAGDPATVEPGQYRLSFRRQRTRRPQLHIGSQQTAGLALDRPVHVGGKEPHAHKRGHAERDAHEEVGEAPPVGAGFPPRQAQGHTIREQAHG